MSDIVERLRAVTYTREKSDGPGGLYWDEPCDADDCGAEKVLINPNGPEAAALIERLRAELAARDAEIAAWLRGQAKDWRDGSVNTRLHNAAIDIESGAYKDQTDG